MAKKSKEGVSKTAPTSATSGKVPQHDTGDSAQRELDRTESAWKRLSPSWPDARVGDLAGHPRRNVEWVIARVRQSSERVLAGPLVKVFRALPTFDIAHLDALAPTADALWHARSKYRQAEAARTRTKVPEKLVAEAKETRERMWRCADYNLSDLPSARAELDDIASVNGSVYLDLAMDLQRLAALYDLPEVRAEFASDRRLYRETDAKDARRLARAILDQLDAGKDDVARWSREVARGWAALEAHYNEVSAAGRFIERNDDPAGRWPSLYAMVRPRSAGAASAEPTPEPAPDA